MNVGMTVTICKVESLEKQVAGGPVFDSRTACQFHAIRLNQRTIALALTNYPATLS